MKNLKLILFVVVFLHLNVSSNENNFQIKHFLKTDYRAANQNWSVSSSSNGFLYFANHQGLLEFDGSNWKLYQLPNETILRSVLVGSDSIIYTSGYREMGYWKPDGKGSLNYFSLNSVAEKFFSANEESWKIVKSGNDVFFHTYSKIYSYKDGRIKTIVAPGSIYTIHEINNQVLISVRNKGIYKIVDNEPVPYIVDPAFENMVVRFIIPFEENQILIGSSSNGILKWDGENLTEWNPEWSEYYKSNEINRAIQMSNGQIVVGTIVDGISIFNKNGERVAYFNTNNGLQNNTVLGIDTDKFGNIWLALDSGIDFITAVDHEGIRIEKIGAIGSVYDAAIFEDCVYLGTNQGLFRKKNSEKDYQLVEEAQSHIWDCELIGDHLFLGHNQGIVTVKNGKARFIANDSGGFSIKEDPFKKDYFIQSTYGSLISIKKEGEEFKRVGLIPGFNDLIRFVEIDHIGNVWASHMHRGIYKLTLNAKRDSVIQKKYFGDNSIFHKDHDIQVFKIENRVVFTTHEKLYTYDDLKDKIIPYDIVNKQLKNFKKAHRIIKAPDHRYWFINKEEIGLFSIFNNNVQLIKTYPRSLFTGNQLIDEFENLFPIDKNKAIFCLENGIAWIDASVNDSENQIENYKPQLRQILLKSNRGGRDKAPIDQDILHVKYRCHNMSLSYSFPLFSIGSVCYSYFMEGIDQTWSECQKESNFDFDRLPSGKYQLFVKAFDQWGNESQTNKIQIYVDPPWYDTIYARFSYLLVILISLYIFRNNTINKAKQREREKHEKKEKELIKLRNDKLRSEITFKSKELANSTMSIIKKNEFLLELKSIFQRQKEELGSRYPDKYFNHIVSKIDRSIGSQDDWEVFEINFERAHEQFLSKLKSKYPKLTPNDLRLCAYLKMNLSSKEIAPLLGVSYRGVENHRYKLRKKFKLEHDENLVEFIMAF